ncbi:sodium-solute symporter [Vibrio sp. JCM 19052]|nr:sodium-solute symporter [Vibrio sp. JCM 19052]
MLNYSRLALVVVIGCALLFALTSNDIIGYITKMISTVMSGMFVCGMLGRFWKRYNWQGALATLAGASIASFAVMLSPDLTAFWGNPVIPSCLFALTAGVAVSLVTPANQVSPEMARAILDDERALMEMELSDKGVLEEDASLQNRATAANQKRLIAKSFRIEQKLAHKLLTNWWLPRATILNLSKVGER